MEWAESDGGDSDWGDIAEMVGDMDADEDRYRLRTILLRKQVDAWRDVSGELCQRRFWTGDLEASGILMNRHRWISNSDFTRLARIGLIASCRCSPVADDQ